MKTICYAIAIFVSTSLFAQSQLGGLKRKAQLDISLQKLPDVPGARVINVAESSPAEKAGVRLGDRVIQVNGFSLPDEYTLLKTLRKIRGGEMVRLSILRKGNTTPIQITFIPSPEPFESYNNLSVEPIQLTNDFGDRLRAIVTKPKQVTGKLPAILFVSWLSCGTIENTNLNDSWVKMLRDVAEQSGVLMLRLEKPGVGDSEGPACADCDLKTELNGYQAAMRYLKGRIDVDTTRLIIFGGSLGGTLGPIVGKGHNVRAYVSGVSVYKTWLEHMIELERRRLHLSGKSQSEASALMSGYVEFHTAMLTGNKTPAQVIQDKPHLASLWYDEPAHQYGRPASFYHQANAQNFMMNWMDVKVPVLIVAGEYDWIMTLEDSRLLTDQLNINKPGQATLLIGQGMDHHWMRYKNPVDAFNETNGEYDSVTVAKMIEWIKKMIK